MKTTNTSSSLMPNLKEAYAEKPKKFFKIKNYIKKTKPDTSCQLNKNCSCKKCKF